MDRRSCLAASCVVLALVLAMPAVGGAADPENSQDRIHEAGAAWFFTSPAGRPATVQVYCGQSRGLSYSSWWRSRWSSDGLRYFAEEQSGGYGQPLSDYYYMQMTGEVPGLDPQMDRGLTTAYVSTPVEVRVQEWVGSWPEDELGNPITPTRDYTTTVFVDLSWTGVGDLWAGSGVTHWRMPLEDTNRPGYILNARGNYLSRDADVAGSVTGADGSTLVTGPADWASLTDGTGGSHMSYTGPPMRVE